MPPVRLSLEVQGLGRDGDYDDVSLQLHAGEVVGLTGLLGSGRTELCIVAVRHEPARSGTIALDGRRIALNTNADAIHRGIAYVSEDRLTLGLILNQSITRERHAHCAGTSRWPHSA